jgi:hypothetical protein
MAAAREIVRRAAQYVSSLPGRIRREVRRERTYERGLVDSAKAWATTGDERVAALEIVLLKRTYIFPWTQLLYAEGGADKVRLVFAAHDVIVRGSGLESLLADLAAQRVTIRREPSRPDRFSAAEGRFIREIVVQKVEAERQ